ncbi:SDR family oxidoreductase [Emcibacter sp. SYSU 3D8]|uniref:SDR family oxidoreductase n=1 Tax=Emcibacter sp. SYSU 3D8 TaxID=3133969 RepID=UPI0031FEEA5C
MPSILVTGANRGLGLEFVRQYAADGWRVYACCRDPGMAADLRTLAGGSNGRISVHALSIGDPDSIRALAADLADDPIDVLVNNAGTYGLIGFAEGGMQAQALGSMDYDSWQHTFAINTMAPLRMIEAFIGNVARSDQKKVFTVSSSMASIGDPAGGHLAYGSTKAAANFLMSTLALELRGQGITVMSLHPGWVETGMGGESAPLKPAESIAGLRQVIATASLATTGRFIGWDGNPVPW